MEEQALIHMNGRAYDYNLARFLSVDPIVADVGNGQALNPYSYILNNPLSGIDPTGYIEINLEIKLIRPVLRFHFEDKIVIVGADNGAITRIEKINRPTDTIEGRIAQTKKKTSGSGAEPSSTVSPTTDKPKGTEELREEADRRERETKAKQKGGGKHSRHSRHERRKKAEEDWNEAKRELEKLRSQKERPKGHKKAIKKKEDEVRHLKRKMDEIGEEHWRRGKKKTKKVLPRQYPIPPDVPDPGRTLPKLPKPKVPGIPLPKIYRWQL